MSAKHTTSPTNGDPKTTTKTKRKKPASAPMNPDSDSDSDDDGSIVNVDFEWFDPQESDFHGLKLLLRQLLDADNPRFDLSALANLILSQPLLGSTVKIPEDDKPTNETDPFALLTVLNLTEHRANPAIAQLTSYLRERCTASGNPALQPIADLLVTPPPPAVHVGLLLSERFVNMPPQIAPPMYSMLLEEMRWALDAGEPYAFTHYLLLSKTYTEIESSLQGGTVVHEDDEQPPQKKKKAKGGRSGGGAQAPTGETFYFHAEDEVFERFALASGNFGYVHSGAEGASDAKRAFQEAGIEPVGHLVLLEAGKLEEAVRAAEAYVNGE